MLLHASLWLPFTPGEVFPFFAEAANLARITPPWLAFEVLRHHPEQMGKGVLIDYQLKLHGIPFTWQSEISWWQPPFGFRDEQRRGPYRRWRHTHTFEACDGGTLCLDDVDYDVPGGRWLERWFVRPRLKRIFEYRQGALVRHFQALAQPAAERVAASWRVTDSVAA